LIGQLERFDFRDITFSKCEFRDAAFVNCEANERTSFTSCRFGGTFDLTPSLTWSKTEFEECEIRGPAALTWDSVLDRDLPNAEELLLDAFRLALGKFWHNGSPKDTIKKDDWKRG